MPSPLPKKSISLPVISINLLPKDVFLDSIVGKFLLWSLSIGRYLVVFTELVVILSFLSRFQLDRKLTDLNENIEQQKQIILSYADTEAKFNTAKDKIEMIKQRQENQIGIDSLSFLEKNLPIDIRISNISFQPQGWNIEASSLSIASLKQMTDKIILANPESDVSLSKVLLNSRTGAIDFSLSLRHKAVVTTSKKVTGDES